MATKKPASGSKKGTTSPKKPAANKPAPRGGGKTTAHVKAHTRRSKDGRVHAVVDHDRGVRGGKVAAAWAGAGTSGLVALGTLLQFGFNLITALFLLLSAIISLVTWLLTADQPQRRTTTRRTPARRAPTRRRTTSQSRRRR